MYRDRAAWDLLMDKFSETIAGIFEGPGPGGRPGRAAF